MTTRESVQAAYEEAARICDLEATDEIDEWRGPEDYRRGAAKCATRIRERAKRMKEPAPHYFLFAWEDYEARGGAGDFVGVFNTLDDAKSAERRGDGAHIATFDGSAFHIVCEWESRVDYPDGLQGKPREQTGWFDPNGNPA